MDGQYFGQIQLKGVRDGSFYDVAVRFVTFSVYGVRKELNAYQFAHSATSLLLTHLVFAHRGHEM